MTRFTGSFVALVTPFHGDGSVHFEKLRELVEWHIAEGTDGIVALGTTGESSTMSHEEDEDVVRCALSAISGRCALIAGSGSNSTETAIMKSVAYDRLGVDGLLLAGRNISGTHMAHSNYRVMPICVAMGEAAGIAAARAVKEGRELRDVDVSQIQKRL